MTTPNLNPVNFEGIQLPGGLRIEPYLPTWTSEHYHVYGNGLDVYNSLCNTLGDDESRNFVTAVETYNTPEVFEGSNWFRDSLTRSMAIMSAEHGIEPTQEGNRQTFMQISSVVMSAEAATMRELTEEMALYARCDPQELPRHFNRINYQLLCKDIEKSLTRDLAVMTTPHAQPGHTSMQRINAYVQSAYYAPSGVRRLVQVAAMSGDKQCIASAHKKFKELQDLGRSRLQDHDTKLIDQFTRLQDGGTTNFAGTIAWLGSRAPASVTHIMLGDSLRKAQIATENMLALKFPALSSVRDRTRGSLAFMCQPHVASAIEHAVNLPHGGQGDAAEFSREVQESPSEEAAVSSIQATEAIDIVEVQHQIDALVDEWSDLEILGESHEQGDGLHRAAKDIESELLGLAQKGQKLPSIDPSRLAMLARLKALWGTDARVVRGIFAGRKKTRSQKPLSEGDESPDEVTERMLQGYLALVLPITHNGERIGEYVIAESIVTGRNATYIYHSLAGDGRPWQNVFGPKKKGVNLIPGVKILQHTRVGERTAAETTEQKLHLLLSSSVEDYKTARFSGENRKGELCMRVGGVALAGSEF
jgi:hypothetical protein